MADHYGLLFPSYFTGPTGRDLQARGKDAVILGAYVGSSRHANMIGLYELPLVYIRHELPVLGDDRAIVRALADLESVGYAFYDRDLEIIWVVEMARIRLGLPPGAPLAIADRRHTAVVRLFDAVKSRDLRRRFHRRYTDQLQLPPLVAEGDGRGIDAPSGGRDRRRGIDAPPKPDQIRSDQDQGSDQIRSGKNKPRAPRASGGNRRSAAGGSHDGQKTGKKKHAGGPSTRDVPVSVPPGARGNRPRANDGRRGVERPHPDPRDGNRTPGPATAGRVPRDRSRRELGPPHSTAPAGGAPINGAATRGAEPVPGPPAGPRTGGPHVDRDDDRARLDALDRVRALQASLGTVPPRVQSPRRARGRSQSVR